MHEGIPRSGVKVHCMREWQDQADLKFSAKSFGQGMYPTQIFGNWKWASPRLPFFRYEVSTTSLRLYGSLSSLLAVPSKSSRIGVVMTYSAVDFIRKNNFNFAEAMIAESFVAFTRHVRALGADGHFCFYFGHQSSHFSWFQAYSVVDGVRKLPSSEFSEAVCELASGFVLLVLTEFDIEGSRLQN